MRGGYAGLTTHKHRVQFDGLNQFKQKQCQLFLVCFFLVIQAKVIEYEGAFHWTGNNFTQFGECNWILRTNLAAAKKEEFLPNDNSNGMKWCSRPLSKSFTVALNFLDGESFFFHSWNRRFNLEIRFFSLPLSHFQAWKEHNIWCVCVRVSTVHEVRSHQTPATPVTTLWIQIYTFLLLHISFHVQIIMLIILMEAFKRIRLYIE